ncbi:cytidylyltransferase domain-containing protein [Prochlorococcus sp. MIT 0602]|uniref:cytidylyltransferase domain-containing protein n=1 Tax=unclassified Prochlorococcus TaxID=2627481 RepID=UPI0039B6AE57
MVKILCIIQARYSSKRLPGKSIFELIKGKTALEVCIDRVSRSKSLDKVVVSTGSTLSNQKIINIANSLDIETFTNEEEDNVLLRFDDISRKLQEFQWIVRVTGDNPLVGHDVINYAIDYVMKNKIVFGSCYYDLNWPNGTIVSVISSEYLRKANSLLDNNKNDKEHVIFALEKLCGRESIPCPNYWQAKGLRYCLDTSDDLTKLKKLIEMYNYNDLVNLTTEEIIFTMKEINGSQEINRNCILIEKGFMW